MNSRLIFEVLFLIAAAIGAGADVATKPWGKTLAFAGLILFSLVLLIP